MQERTQPINNPHEFLSSLERHEESVPSNVYNQPLLCFRGEAKRYEYPLIPTIWRSGHGLSVSREDEIFNPDNMLTRTERQSIKLCQDDCAKKKVNDPFFLKFKLDKNLDSIHWVTFAHYLGYRTRLIDVTTHPLTALFFACSQHFDENGYVYFFRNNYHYLPSVCYERNFQDIFKCFSVGEFRPPQGTLFVVEPPEPNKRIVLQGNLMVGSQIEGSSYWKEGGGVIEICANKKQEILGILSKWNLGPKTLFPSG